MKRQVILWAGRRASAARTMHPTRRGACAVRSRTRAPRPVGSPSSPTRSALSRRQGNEEAAIRSSWPGWRVPPPRVSSRAVGRRARAADAGQALPPSPRPPGKASTSLASACREQRTLSRGKSHGWLRPYAYRRRHASRRRLAPPTCLPPRRPVALTRRLRTTFYMVNHHPSGSTE